jgi:hypothetical protein
MKRRLIACWAAGVLLVATGVAQAGTIDSAALYYALDGNATDGTVNGRDGTIIGTASFVADRDGNAGGALSLNGSTWVSAPVNTVGAEQTFAGWFSTSAVSGLLFGPTAGTFHTYNVFIDATGHIGFRQYRNGVGGYVDVLGPVVNDGLWHHVVTLRSDASKSIELYVDGVSVDTYTESDPGWTSWAFGNSLGFGHVDDLDFDGYFVGKLDDVALWSRKLSADEIQEVFGGSPTLVPLPSAAWMGLALLGGLGLLRTRRERRTA